MHLYIIMGNSIIKVVKFFVGFILFVIGLGLIYLGCKYDSSILPGIFKQLDALVYLVCFGTSIFGIDMMYKVIAKDKKEEKPAQANEIIETATEHSKGQSAASNEP